MLTATAPPLNCPDIWESPWTASRNINQSVGSTLRVLLVTAKAVKAKGGTLQLYWANAPSACA
jgi:hypothetical protein